MRVPLTYQQIYDQLLEAERDLDYDTWDMCWVAVSRYQLKWRRHYLLKRLLTLQLKEFDNG